MIHNKYKIKDLTFTMKTKYLIASILITVLFLTTNSFAVKSNFFSKGKILFDENKITESKFFFEKDIVFNPKNERSYLYLAKIFKKSENDQEQEVNLTNVLLLNPDNDEAIYMLVLLKIKQSNYKEAQELLEKFSLVCKTYCSKKTEIKDKLDKLMPVDEKDKN